MKSKIRSAITWTFRGEKPGDAPAVDRRGLRRLLPLIAGTAVGLSAALATAGQVSETSSKTMFNDLNWTAGEDGANHALLWSHKDGSNGFLIRAGAGFTTGLLTRRSDYRAFVASGRVRNDGPEKEAPEPMERGTFWVQPAGTEHSLTCVADCVIYIEPEGGWGIAEPGSVKSDLEPVRIPLESMPWVDAPNTRGAVKLAHVWGDPTNIASSGFFLFFKAGFPGFPHVHTNDYDGVVLQGRPRHWEPGETGIEATQAGSHLFQAGGAAHDDSCDPGADCISYFRFHGKFDIFPADAD